MTFLVHFIRFRRGVPEVIARSTSLQKTLRVHWRERRPLSRDHGPIEQRVYA